MAFTIIVAELGGRSAALVTAVVSAFSLNFFLTEPYLTLAISKTDDVIAFVALAVCGLIAAAFGRRREQMSEPAERAAEAGGPRRLVGRLRIGAPLDEVLDDLRKSFRLRAIVLRDDAERAVAAALGGQAPPSRPETDIAPDTLLPADEARLRFGLRGLSLPEGGGRLRSVPVRGSVVESPRSISGERIPRDSTSTRPAPDHRRVDPGPRARPRGGRAANVAMNDPRHEHRPDPEALLARVKEEEARKGRGHLMLFFGAAAGVGKTYAMLEAARALKARRGRRRRRDTSRPTGGPRRRRCSRASKSCPRGWSPTADDAEGVRPRRRARAPARADSSSTSSPTPTRRAPGTPSGGRTCSSWSTAASPCYTTHERAARREPQRHRRHDHGVIVRETVPDSVLERADQIELVDLPPDELLSACRKARSTFPSRRRRPSRISSARET